MAKNRRHFFNEKAHFRSFFNDFTLRSAHNSEKRRKFALELCKAAPPAFPMKKLDIYILKKFLLLFAASFFVCLFIFMMQFTWRYVNDLVGKGLTLTILAQFFWYMSQTMVAPSLPLAVLLSSLITFGNLSESLELLSIKAAGISLLRVLMPLAAFCLLIGGMSFHFQNKIAPEAQKNLTSLLISMKTASPAVEIPEGIFYNGVPNVNLYVQRKDSDTGKLYQVIIYKTDQGFERAQIVLADSAFLEMSSDKQHLTLDLWHGEQFENLQSQEAMALGNVPYDRETFQYKRFIIDFDANFNVMDAEQLRGNAMVKSIAQIDHDIDSINADIDSIGKVHFQETFAREAIFASSLAGKSAGLTAQTGLPATTPKSEPAKGQVQTKAHKPSFNFDEFLSKQDATVLRTSKMIANNRVQIMQMEYQWRNDIVAETLYQLRLHQREWHKKITLSLACLLFFFIGAPLGAVIGKGGLGMPTVVSVLIFVLYYIIDTSCMKMGRQGTIPVWLGMWVSTFIMLPCGTWITYRCNKDKMHFNITSLWNKIKTIRRWHPFPKLWKTSERGRWSSSWMTKIAKMKATLSWLPKKLRKKR